MKPLYKAIKTRFNIENPKTEKKKYKYFQK